ncbi:MAG: hypothetical protein Q7S34_02055 [bacterium]|nr:hypothetical protein [bacterium]
MIKQDMKYGIATFLIMIMMTAVFGFVALDHGMNHQKIGCITSAFNDTDCPTSLMGSVLHHIAMFETFSAVPVSPIFILLIAFLLLALISFFFADLKRFVRQRIRALFDKSRALSFGLYIKQKIDLAHWLSLFENSPSF